MLTSSLYRTESDYLRLVHAGLRFDEQWWSQREVPLLWTCFCGRVERSCPSAEIESFPVATGAATGATAGCRVGERMRAGACYLSQFLLCCGSPPRLVPVAMPGWPQALDTSLEITCCCPMGHFNCGPFSCNCVALYGRVDGVLMSLLGVLFLPHFTSP